MQALCGHSLAWGLKCYDRYTKRNSEKRCERATKRMPNEPYLCVGKHKGDVVIKILKTQNGHQHRTVQKNDKTYGSDRVKQAFLDKGVLEAVLITFPAASVTVAHSRPRPVDTCAAAAEQQVIIELISFRGRPLVDPLGGRAFDGKDDSAVVICREYVPSEAVIIRLPPNGSVLRASGPRVSM